MFLMLWLSCQSQISIRPLLFQKTKRSIFKTSFPLRFFFTQNLSSLVHLHSILCVFVITNCHWHTVHWAVLSGSRELHMEWLRCECARSHRLFTRLVSNFPWLLIHSPTQVLADMDLHFSVCFIFRNCACSSVCFRFHNDWMIIWKYSFF